MENQAIKQSSLNYREIILDEIALDGLDGIVIDFLWRRIEHRVSMTLTPKFKARLWRSIINFDTITFYKLPEPRARTEILNRFNIVHEPTGYLLDHDEYLDGPYEYHPVAEAYGSCEHYSTRVELSKDELQKLSLEEVVAEYGDSLVMVASLEERWQALAPHVGNTQLKSLSITHICLLELVGKSRLNGQMSIGKTHLFKIFKDSKIQYYFRKVLQDLDLIRTSNVLLVCGGRGSSGILIRLKRFYQPTMFNIPQHGKIFNIVQYLKREPNYCANVEDLVKNNVMLRSQRKKLRKTTNFLHFDDKPINRDDWEPVSKRCRLSDNQQGPNYVSLITESDEEASEDETCANAAPVKCQFNVGVNIFRQAYERLLEAGLKGMTQIEIGQVLGLEFYVSRTICRSFRSKNLVREILEDHGRQRTSRYIAIAATGEGDKIYTEEKKKLMDVLNISRNIEKLKTEPEASTSSEEPPAKISKLDDGNRFKEENGITEVTIIEGQENFAGFSELLKAKKAPTLRHLKYANGILKVTREKLAVTGYVNLSQLVSAEIGEPLMDTKAVHTIVKRLFTDGLLRMINLKWPGHKERYSKLICAPHVKPTDTIIKTLYKEICVRTISNRKAKACKKEPVDCDQEITYPTHAYPRYLKARKLHEFIINHVYFGEQTASGDLAPGFASLVHLLPEMPVELALGNISNQAMKELTSINPNEQLLKSKLRDVPLNVYKLLLQSKSLMAALKANLIMMASFGLIQLCHKVVALAHHSGVLQYVFYVNRNAKLINTTGIWPRPNADLKALEKRFRFESPDDVTSYWNMLFKISVSTTIVDRVKGQPFPTAPLRHLGEVTDYDNGETFGDERGACGFDSSYYLEMHRHWEVMRTVNYKKITPVKVKSTKKMIKKEKQYKPKKSVKRPEKKFPPGKKMVRAKRRRLPEFALKWTKKEDKLIMLCKAAMTIMSPSSQPGCLTVRNLIAKDILSIHDVHKTPSNCHTRALILESNSTLAHERECLINEMKRRPHLISKYEGILKKIRLSNSLNMAKYINDARTAGMELVWLLLQVSQSKCYNRVMPCVAINLEELETNYSIVQSTSNKPFNLYQESPDCDTTVATLKEAIIMTLTFKNDTSLEASQKIYYFLEKYDEKTLRIAIDHLRKSGAICIREKHLSNVLNKFSFQEIAKTSSSSKATMTTYKLSAAYQRRMMSKLNLDFVDDIWQHLSNELPKNPVPSSAMNCVLCELQASGEIHFEIVTATTVTGSHRPLMEDDDANYKLKFGTLICKTKNDVNIFSERLTCSDYEEIIQSILSDATIYPANTDYPSGDKMLEFLAERRESGATFLELKEKYGFDSKTLVKKLERMEEQRFVKRVGFLDNLIVLNEFVDKWSLSNLEELRIIPTPWLTLLGSINTGVFLKWCAVILNKIFDYPGMSISAISEDCDYLTSRATQDVCTFLSRTKCIELKILTEQQPDLFSDDYLEPEEEEYHKFTSTWTIFAFPVKDSFIRFTCLRKTMLINAEE